jgi:hypothetical protein
MSRVPLGPLKRVLGEQNIAAFCSDPDSRPEQLISAAKSLRRVHGEQGRIYGELLASNPAMPMEGLIELIERHSCAVTEHPVFRMRLATDPGFLFSLDSRLHCFIAVNPNVDPRLIRMLAGPRSRPIEVRKAAAFNPGCPIDLLKEFPRHAWPVRECLAKNRSLTPELQRRLAVDPKRQVRRQLAVHPRLIPDLFDQLSALTEHKQVRLALIRNRSTPRRILDRLHREGTPMVREAVEKRREQGDNFFQFNFFPEVPV